MAVSGSSSGRMTDLQVWRDQHRELSPERNKVWSEPAKSNRRVPVVYYLSRNGQLEHPHFMEVPLSSPRGLFLRDVIGRLNVLRGNTMSAMYSWSCKRSYKNGFVWHDLSENDFIYPAHGHEYVLKGSEILQRQPQNQIIAAEDAAGSGSYPPPSESRRRNQSCSSIDYDAHEYSVYKAEPSFRYAADASTQTDDARRRRRPTEMVEEKISKEPEREIRDEIEISPPPSDSSPETLETLLKSDGRSMLQAETVKREPARQQIQRATNKSSVLMQLISCGSLSFRDCGAGQVISQYRMKVPRGGGGRGRGGGRVKLEEKEYFSGSIVDTKKDELPTLKRCSSYNADRSV